MCHAVSLRKSEKEIEEHFHATQRVHFLYEPYFYQSGYEHTNLFIIPQSRPEEIHPAMWGLVPEFALYNIDEFYRNNLTLNARTDTIFDSSVYKASIKQRRCLIIADGFYKSRFKNETMYPYFCHLTDDSLFAIAGVYSEIDEGEYSCSILTKEANAFFATIDNAKQRMPLVLDSQFQEEWLRKDLTVNGIKELIRVGFSSEEFEAYPVSLDLLKPGEPKDVPWAISKVHYPGLDD